MKRLHATIPLFVLAASAAPACTAQKPEPRVASSATQPGYAQSYPALADDLYARFLDREREVRKLIVGFTAYPDQLKNPDWSRVLTIVQRADEAGQSAVYVERYREVSGAQTFFVEEKEEITRKVAGSAQYVAKKKECDVDLYGPSAYALKEAVDKQLEKRMRARNEAEAEIDRHRDSLGKENADALEREADDIALASYIVHIDLPTIKVKAKEVLAEADQVKKTLDRAMSDQQTAGADRGRSAAEKKAEDARAAQLLSSSRRLDAAVLQLQGLVKDMDTRIAQHEKEYEDAIGALERSVQSRTTR